MAVKTQKIGGQKYSGENRTSSSSSSSASSEAVPGFGRAAFVAFISARKVHVAARAETKTEATLSTITLSSLAKDLSLRAA